MPIMSASTLSINACASSSCFGHSKAFTLKGICNIDAAANAAGKDLAAIAASSGFTDWVDEFRTVALRRAVPVGWKYTRLSRQGQIRVPSKRQSQQPATQTWPWPDLARFQLRSFGSLVRSRHRVSH